MLAVTSDYVFAAGNIVLGLIRHRPQKDFDVAIFYEEMLENDKKIFEETGICHLHQYVCPADFAASIRRRCPKFNNEEFAKFFSFLKFAKFEIFTLLDEYENAVWLDADISIQKDPFPIVGYAPFAITIDKDWSVQNNFTAPIKGYDMNRDGVCSAVFLVSDTLPYHAMMRQWCYDMAEACAPFFKNIDQGIFNLLLQHFHVPYQLLPLYEYQCITNRAEGVSARIVHFGAAKKIWNTPEILAAFPEWYRVHEKWLALGGSDFAKPSGWKIMNAFDEIRKRNNKILSLEKEKEGLLQEKKKLTSERDSVRKERDSLNNQLSRHPEDEYMLTIFDIPLWKRKIKGHRYKYYLFGFIHVFTIRCING